MWIYVIIAACVVSLILVIVSRDMRRNSKYNETKKEDSIDPSDVQY